MTVAGRPSSSGPDPVDTRRPSVVTGWALVSLIIGPALVMLDSGIANLALQPLAVHFRVSTTTVQWVVSGYLLALALGLTLTTPVTRRWGLRRVYVGALGVFIAASIACAAAPSIEWLIGARLVQGFGGAPLVPLALSALMSGSEEDDRPINPAIGAVMFIAPVLGPSLAGVLLTLADWRLLFLINVPIGLIGWVAAHRVPSTVRSSHPDSPGGDLFGLLLLMIGVPALVLGGATIASGAVPPWATIGLLSIGVPLLVGYAVRSRRIAAPAVNLAAVSGVRSVATLTVLVITSVVAFTTVVVVPLYVQGAQHGSPISTGLALLPQGMAIGVGAAAAAPLVGRLGVRAVTACGTVLFVVALVLLATRVALATPLWVIALILTGRGLAVGLIIQPLLSAWLSAVPSRWKTDCSTVFTVVERIGGSIGVGLLVSMYSRRAAGGPDGAFGAVMFTLAGLVAISLLCLPWLPARAA